MGSLEELRKELEAIEERERLQAAKDLKDDVEKLEALGEKQRLILDDLEGLTGRFRGKHIKTLCEGGSSREKLQAFGSRFDIAAAAAKVAFFNLHDLIGACKDSREGAEI